VDVLDILDVLDRASKSRTSRRGLDVLDGLNVLDFEKGLLCACDGEVDLRMTNSLFSSRRDVVMKARGRQTTQPPPPRQGQHHLCPVCGLTGLLDLCT